MDWSWIETTWTALLMSFLSALGAYIALVVLTRTMGLRSFSKMSSFDFAITVAFGSLLATAIVSPQPPLLLTAGALSSLFAIQWAVSRLRVKSSTLRRVFDNQPRLLMWEGEILHGELSRSGVTQGDLLAKLREANVLRFGQVRAVVLESTGDVSVLHENKDGPGLEEAILEGVRRPAHLVTGHPRS